MGNSRALGLLIVAATLGGGAVAQMQVIGGSRSRPVERPPVPDRAEQRPVIRVDVGAVVVDVSVFDAKGQPVTGLTAADFTIVEGGRPRPITTFQAVQLAAPTPPPAAWPAHSPDVVRNDPAADEARAIVIVLDDATMPPNYPRWVEAGRRTAAGIVAELRPGDVAAVLRTRDGSTQEFTADHTRLLRFIDQFRPGTRLLDPGVAQEGSFLSAPLRLMTEMAGYLAALPERRKLMFYIGVGVPINLDIAAKPVPLGADNAGSRALRDLHLRLNESLADLLDRARRTNIHIYSFDPSGTGGIEQAVRDAINDPIAQELAPRVRQAALTFLRTVAETTGGRAVVENNAPEAGIAAAFAENQSFYLLGYTDDAPAGRRANGDITVRVRQPGLAVRHSHRQTSDARAEAAKKAPQTAIETILPHRDLPMQIWAAPYWDAARKEPAVAVVVGLRPAAPVSGPVTESTEVTIVAFDNRAKPHGGHTLKADMSVAPTPVGWIPYEVVSQLRLRPGTYRIRAAADNARLGKSGSVFTDVDVPDFAKARLTMSGLALAPTPRWAAVPKDRLASLLPLAPSTRRHFASADVIDLFAMLHQGAGATASAVDVRVSIVNERGAKAFEHAAVVAAAQFGATGAGIPLRLPPSTFGRGRYLLTFSASLPGHSVERHLSFQID